MSILTTGADVPHSHSGIGTWRRLALAAGLLAVVAGCASSAASPTANPLDTVAGATATPVTTPTPAPTATAIATATPSATPKPAPTATPKPTAAPHSTATPPALAVGLCTAAQLKLTITSWVGDPGAGTVYAHVTATNVSSASCNMRGSSRAQILKAGSVVIADAGSSAAKVKASDPVYAVAPHGTVSTIVQWGNWCKAAPAQNLRVAMVEPFGLGKIVAPANGVGSVPTCYASGSSTVVSSEAWMP